MVLVQIILIQLLKAKSVENITPKSFEVNTVTKVSRINRIVKVNSGTNKVIRDIIIYSTFIYTIIMY